MTASLNKGNNPELWKKLLGVLDDRLQLGLLDRLRRVASYHFESDTLFIEAGSDEDETYLLKESTKQQLEVFAQDATGTNSVIVKLRG